MSLEKNKKKTVVVCNFPRFSGEIWLPFLWAQAKTYYERYGQRNNEWRWWGCETDVYGPEYVHEIKSVLEHADPDIFAISLYVWNYTLAHEIAAWVKQKWPKCIIISGGPHQYFKHDINWFRKHPYLDASLPGDCYGEQCFLEILDLYDNQTQTVDWRMVTDIWYPSTSKSAIQSTKTMDASQKKTYKFNWSAFVAQKNLLLDFVKYKNSRFPDSMLLSVLETTRGCPYGCTYCDWGGGINTTVLKKDIDTVKQDIDALLEFDLTYIYLADANFGIFGQRDVDIMRYIAERKIKTKQTFGVGFGGYAKTENKLPFIKDILQVDIDNELSMTKELKISMQTLDPEILTNIDRKNIDLDRQLEMYTPLSRHNKLPIYVEMIMGLPGITLDKYYHELNILGGRQLSVQWFEWILLPETPAFSAEYRKKFAIQTIIKRKGWAVHEGASEREVVVATNSYSSGDYQQMLLSNSLYHLFVLGGFYKNTVSWICDNHRIGIGDLCKDVYENFFCKDESCGNFLISVDQRWQDILNDPDMPCTVNIDGFEVYMAYFFVALCFQRPDFATKLINYLTRRYDVPCTLSQKEDRLHVNKDNFGRTVWRGLYRYDYSNQNIFTFCDVHALIGSFRTYVNSGSTMRAQVKLLGVV